MKIEVMILGERRAGKTLYLAGLHGAMGSAQPEIPVTLRIEGPRRVILGNIYSRVIRPDDPEFPEGTQWGLNEWLFDCVITGADNKEYIPFSVAYADYAGEMINPDKTLDQLVVDPGMQKFFEREQTAHAFLILIDGHKMYRLLKRDEAVTGWLDDYLPRVLQMVTRGRPVHLVITKWSILEKEGISLDTLKETLLTQRTLKNFAESRALRGSTVRLIPVDVVGPFGQLNDDGRMVKVPEARVAPVNLLVPFAALLPDIIRHKLSETAIIIHRPNGVDAKGRKPRFFQIRNQITEQLRTLLRQKHRDIIKQAEDPLVKFVTVLLHRSTRSEESSQHRIKVARNAVRGTLLFIEHYVAQMEEQLARQQVQLRRELNEKQGQIDSEQAAVELAIAGCAARLREFELQYPASILHVPQP